jgi:type IV secretion system protein VirB6
MGFFQTFWTWLNSQVTGYIADTTVRVASAVEPAVVSLGAVYVMLWGYLLMTGRIDEPFSAGVARLVRLTLVLGVSLHLWLYNDVIVDTFYRAPAQLASAVVGVTDPVTTVDAIWDRAGAVGATFWQLSGRWNLASVAFAGAAFLVWLVIGLLCVYVMYLIALSAVASSVLLATGPLFVALCLFDGTRRFFEAWLAQLVHYALITILTVLVSAILLHVMQSYATQTAARGTDLTVVDSLDLLLMAGLVMLLMRQIVPIAAGLAGGVALNSFNIVSRPALATLRAPKAIARLAFAQAHWQNEKWIAQSLDTIAAVLRGGRLGADSLTIGRDG